jgi:hypothetical protein
VIALGGRDSVDAGRDFVKEFGLRTPRLVYSESASAWGELGVRFQPAAILFDGGGNEKQRWTGPFDFEQAAEIAQSLRRN